MSSRLQRKLKRGCPKPGTLLVSIDSIYFSKKVSTPFGTTSILKRLPSCVLGMFLRIDHDHPSMLSHWVVYVPTESCVVSGPGECWMVDQQARVKCPAK